MTTAARPTWETARGGRGKGEGGGDLSALSKQYSSRDLPSHTKLKYRQEGQNTSDETRSRDFRRELEDRERNAREKRDRNRDSSSSSKRPRLEAIPAANLDADDPVDDDDDDDDDESSDDEDETAELLAELQKIKKERALEKQKLESEKKQEDERIRTEIILKGNPLLNPSDKATQEFKVKRRWDDDVVFKNCTKGEEDRKKKAFINDTLRSEFHKKFMEKYVK
ncbi:spliceosome-associated protein CWC15 homolog [Gigantopelta aegis]|uniref:spliceosome-associated protein CWC15 homolog n=1 Tax=Gigantopelta aegis TaxID=1735272 RepID=UPI001B888194|nr:spliceosome-associated protein CWC15 homolog [Gigantopelta aegis]